MKLSRREVLLATGGLVACRTGPTDPAPTATATASPNPTPAAPAGGRAIEKIITAQTTRDGAGVKLSRALGGRPLPMLDPFLLLDEFHSDDPNDYQASRP